MGSWNGTCMVTRLPILYGEKVKLFLLYNQNVEYSRKYNEISVLNKSSMVYSNEMLNPAFYPISGEYDDGGTIQYIVEDFNYKLIENYFKNKFGLKIKIKNDRIIENWSLVDVIEGIERGRCHDTDPSYWSEQTQTWIPFDLSFTLIRDDVYEHIGEKMLSESFSNWKHRGTVEKMLVDEFNDELEFIKKLEAIKESKDIEAMKNHFFETISRSDNRIFRKGVDGTSFLLKAQDYENILADNIKDDAFVKEVYKMWSTYKCLEIFMSDARISWMVQSGGGSQDSSWELTKMLAEKVIDICNKKIAEYEEY